MSRSIRGVPTDGRVRLRYASSARERVPSDFATGDKGGDVGSLIAYLDGISQGEAARLLERLLGPEVGGRRDG